MKEIARVPPAPDEGDPAAMPDIATRSAVTEALFVTLANIVKKLHKFQFRLGLYIQSPVRLPIVMCRNVT